MYFPVCTDDGQWKKVLKDWVGEIDPEFQKRLRAVQPFNYMPLGGTTILSMLHDLDIVDKHRDMLVITADVEGIQLGGHYKIEDPSAPTADSLELFPDVVFRDGAVLGTLGVGTRIRSVDQLIFRPAVKLQFVYEENVFDLMPVLQHFVTESRRCLEVLLAGLPEADESIEPSWPPL